MQLFDIVFDTSFFLPTGLIVGGQPAEISGGGSPVLWQHLFWFLAHPEVYVLILPAVGMVSEIITNNTRRPLWGYKTLIYAVMTLGFLSFIVWAHHMYLTGMGTVISTFFQTTTMIISIPSVIILTCLFLTLWGGSMRINAPMLFALAFLPMFGIGGLTGLPLGFSYSDLYLHDTYYVIAHFHYIVAPGTIFAFFAGIYYWFPKATGRYMSDYWGRVHFWLSLVFMNLIFMPMFLQGLAGMHRRMYDGGVTYAGTATPEEGVVGILTKYVEMNQTISIAAWCLGLSQIPFIINFFYSITNGKKVESPNPWKATTLDWQTPTPPPHGNFDGPIEVFNAPYEYSAPGTDDDFLPQNVKPSKGGDTTSAPSTEPVPAK
jgi:cytochrome c oxidase subunit 1